MAMQYVISDFREKHRVQKMNLVTLTDGDSNNFHARAGSDITNGRSYGRRYVIEVNGKAIDLSGSSYSAGREHTAAFVKAIGNMGVTTMNYFIASRGYELNGELSRSLGYAQKSDVEFKAKKKEIRDTGVAIFDDNAGYDRRFVLPTDKMSEGIDDLDVDADMTVAKIAKAFTKANGSKKKSKVITQKFAELVA
jgi:hypothetical protein